MSSNWKQLILQIILCFLFYVSHNRQKEMLGCITKWSNLSSCRCFVNLNHSTYIHKYLQDQHSIKYSKWQELKPYDFQTLITFLFTTVESTSNVFSINVDRSCHWKKNYSKLLFLVKRNMKEFSPGISLNLMDKWHA